MLEREKHDLQKLDYLERWLMVNLWRRLLWQQKFRQIPLPGKLGIINSLVVCYFLWVIPRPDQMPPIFIPLLWMGAYSLSLSLCMFIPSAPRRLKTEHWVGR